MIGHSVNEKRNNIAIFLPSILYKPMRVQLNTDEIIKTDLPTILYLTEYYLL